MNWSQILLRNGLGLVLLQSLAFCGQTPKQNELKQELKTAATKQQKMKIEIWSDVMCPFCYIGKRKFEAALALFKHKNNVEIIWKSFQLNPSLKTDTTKNTIQHLSETKGWSMDYTRNTISYVTNMAKEVGLDYDFEKAVVANSFDAHRLIQLAKTFGKGDTAEERLFKAYFTEGKNTADANTLIQIGTEIGLNPEHVKQMLEGKSFSSEVNKDIAEAEQLGISGVPFFIMDRKFAVSGAQDVSVFLDSLNKAWDDFYKKNDGIVNPKVGQACTPEGECK